MADRAEMTFTIASGGTSSDKVMVPPGTRLVALIVPTLDSTTIKFNCGNDPAALKSLYDSAAAEVTLGTANTGAKVQAVSQAVKDASLAGFIQLVVAAQTGGARTIIGICEHVA